MSSRMPFEAPRTPILNRLRCSFWSLALGVVFAGALSAPCLSLQAAEATGRTIEVKLRSIGPTLSKADIPQFHALLDRWATELSEAVNSHLRDNLGPEAPQIPFEWYISNDPTVNASFEIVKDTGHDKAIIVLNRGAITEAFRQAMENPSDPEAMNTAAKRVLGILQHEFAHALDKLDPEGIEKTHASQSGNWMKAALTKTLNKQAVELKTDLLAIDLAYRAHQPRDAIYQTQLFLGEVSKGSQDTLSNKAYEGYLSTHPTNSVRTGAARLGIVGTRFTRGAPSQEGPLISNDIRQDLETLNQGASQPPFKKYQTIDEALGDLEKFRRKDTEKTNSLDFTHTDFSLGESFNFTHAKLSLEELIHDGANRITPTGRRRIIEFYKDYLSNPKLYPISVPHRFTKDSSFTFPAGHPGYDLHPSDKVKLFGESLLFQNSNFMRELRSAIKPVFDQIAQKHQAPFEFFSKSLGERTVLNLFDSELRDLLTAAAKSSSPQEHLKVSQIFGQNQSDEVSRWFYQRVIPRLGDTEKLELELGYKHLLMSQFTDLQDNGASEASFKKKFFSDPPGISNELLEFYKKQAAIYWKDRGRYGVYDYLAKGSSLRWSLIWKLLGISPGKGRRELNQAIRDFTSGPEYVELLKNFPKDYSFEQDHRYNGSKELEIRSIANRTASIKDDDLLPYLRGEKNPYFQTLVGDDRARTLARRFIAGAHLLKKPELLEQELYKAIGRPQYAAFSGPQSIFSKIDQGLSKVLGIAPEALKKELTGAKHPELDKALNNVFLGLARSHPQRAKILSDIYTTRSEIPPLYRDSLSSWMRDPDLFEKVSNELKAAGSISYHYENFKVIKHNPRVDVTLTRSAIKRLSPALPVLTEELDRLPEKNLPKFFSSVFGHLKQLDLKQERAFENEFQTDKDLLTGKSWDALKSKFLNRLRGTHLTWDQKLVMFQVISHIGPTHDTDRFFVDQILPELRKLPAPQQDKILLPLLEEQKLWNQKLAFNLAEPYLQRKATSTLGQSPDPMKIKEFSKYLETYLPGASPEKDKFIESLAWHHQIDGRKSLSLLETLKSTHPSQIDPQWVNMMSSASTVMEKLRPEEARQLFQFLLTPKDLPFPDNILTRLEQQMEADAIASNPNIGASRKIDKTSKREIDFFIRNTRESIERAAYVLSREERLPIFEMLMHASDDPMVKSKDFTRSFVRSYLHYPPGSNDEKILIALLHTFQPEEVPGALAYLVSRQPGEARDLAKTLSLFGTPGKKFGQIAALWDLFPSETKKLNQMKDSTAPMSKLEILKALERQLTPEDFSKIRSIKEILGSASIKTTALIKLKDGTEVVASLVNPNAEAQIRTHFGSVRKMIPELKSQGVPGLDGSTVRAIDLAEKQALAELNMIEEAEKTRRMSKAIRGVASSMWGELGRWRLNVPNVSSAFKAYPGVIFTEKAGGSTLNRLQENPGQVKPALLKKAEAISGKVIIRSYFREGLVISDPHRGNILLDPKNKWGPTIHFIDPGQNVELQRNRRIESEDDVAKFSKFLRALKSKNAKDIAQTGLMLSSNSKLSSDQMSHLIASISKTLVDETHPDKLMLKLDQDFANAGVLIDERFSFNTLKAFTTISQENYLSRTELENLFTREITRDTFFKCLRRSLRF